MVTQQDGNFIVRDAFRDSSYILAVDGLKHPSGGLAEYIAIS